MKIGADTDRPAVDRPGIAGAGILEVTRLYRETTVAAVTSPILFEGGEGCWIRGADGARYLDLLSGYGVASTGWNHPRLVARAREQAERSLFAPPMLPTREAADFADLLLQLMGAPEGWRCVRATGGADANEQVLKAISAWARSTGRPAPVRIARFERSYHGGTMGTLALSDVERFGLPRPLAPSDHPMLAFPRRADEAQLADDLFARDSSVAAVIVEPVLGSGGVHPFPDGYLAELRRCCDRRGVLLVFDEVMTGCGRVGGMLAAHMLRAWPDAITLGKGLSAGAAPAGAALLSPDLAAALSSRDDTSGTFAWTPLACALAGENLRIIEDERLHLRAATMGARLRERLHAVFTGVFGDRATVRGVGLMIGVDIAKTPGGDPDAAIVRRLVLRCKQKGVVVGASWDWSTMVVLPPLVLGEEEAAEAVCRVEDAARATAR